MVRYDQSLVGCPHGWLVAVKGSSGRHEARPLLKGAISASRSRKTTPRPQYKARAREVTRDLLLLRLLRGHGLVPSRLMILRQDELKFCGTGFLNTSPPYRVG